MVNNVKLKLFIYSLQYVSKAIHTGKNIIHLNPRLIVFTYIYIEEYILHTRWLNLICEGNF